VTINWIKIPGRALSAQAKYTKDYKAQIVELARRKFLQPLTGDLTVVLLFVVDKKNGQDIDLDNAVKLVLDALKGIAYLDDIQVNPHWAERFYCGQRVVTSAPILPHTNDLQRTVEIDQKECVFIGLASPRF
jgi:Holliday junction resolvase RusA-like endonuclease